MENFYDNEEVFNNYTVLRENPLSYNEVVEMPVMKRMLPELKDKTILDIGCGMGHLIDYMLHRSPQETMGIDLSSRMIDYCKNKERFESVEFRQGNFMELEFDRKFNVIVSSLVFHYFEDFDALCKKLSKLMTPDGNLIFSMEHPIVTAGKTPETTADDVHLKVDHYFDETKRSMYWPGLDAKVEKYHHTISTIFNNLIQNDFVIEKVTDLGQTEEVFKSYSDERIEKLSHYPPFILIKCKKH